MFIASLRICFGFVLLVFPFEYGLGLVSAILGMIGAIFVLAGLAIVINGIIDQKDKTSSPPPPTDQIEQPEPNS